MLQGSVATVLTVSKRVLHSLAHAIPTKGSSREGDWSYFYPQIVNVDFETQSCEAIWKSLYSKATSRAGTRTQIVCLIPGKMLPLQTFLKIYSSFRLTSMTHRRK